MWGKGYKIKVSLAQVKAWPEQAEQYSIPTSYWFLFAQRVWQNFLFLFPIRALPEVNASYFARVIFCGMPIIKGWRR